jgi:Fatty acid desaturase.
VNMSSAATDPRSIPARLNLLLAVLALTMSGWLWIVLPLLLPALPALGWSLLIVVLATTFYWSLLHEGIHAVLLPDRRLNDVLSRLLAIGFPAPFAVLRFGHLKHHQFNRTAIDRSEVFDPALTTRSAAAWRYYPQLLIGLYASEVAALLLVWLPRPGCCGWHSVCRPSPVCRRWRRVWSGNCSSPTPCAPCVWTAWRHW